MQAPSLLLLPDRSIGELHSTAIPDQDLMELLIEDMSDDFKKIFQHSSGKYVPVCRWKGVTCNAQRNVLHVQFAKFKKGKAPAKIDFAYLPRSLVNFDMPLQKLHGTVETSALPRKLELLSIRNNDIYGTFDFRCLPEHLRILDILGNHFSGSVNFDSLPPTIEKIRALDNAFIGCIALDKLPRSLIDLDLSQNKLRGSLNLQSTARDLKVLTLADNAFFGEVCFDHLPQKVEHVFLESNRLCGSIRILRLPESLVGLHLQKNEFSGIAVIRKDLYSHIALQTQHLIAVVDENGRAYKRFDRSDSDKVHKDVVAMFGFVTFLDYATRSQFLNPYGKPLALEDWKGVELDSYSRVVAIRFTEDSGVQELKGSICFDHLPKFVKVCEICPDHHAITGVIHTENLPRSLEELIVPSKALSGEFQFERLPMILRNLDISKNHFSGYVVLDSLGPRKTVSGYPSVIPLLSP